MCELISHSFTKVNKIQPLIFIQTLQQSRHTGAYIPQNLTAFYSQKTIRFTENRQRTSCVWTKKLPRTYEGADLAQNRGQIWTQYA